MKTCKFFLIDVSPPDEEEEGGSERREEDLRGPGERRESRWPPKGPRSSPDVGPTAVCRGWCRLRQCLCGCSKNTATFL